MEPKPREEQWRHLVLVWIHELASRLKLEPGYKTQISPGQKSAQNMFHQINVTFDINNLATSIYVKGWDKVGPVRLGYWSGRVRVGYVNLVRLVWVCFSSCIKYCHNVHVFTFSISPNYEIQSILRTTTTLGTPNLLPLRRGGRRSEVAVCDTNWNRNLKEVVVVGKWLLFRGGR